MSYKRIVGPRGSLKIIGVKDIPGDRKYVEQNFDVGTIFLKGEKPGKGTQVYSVSPTGDVMVLHQKKA